MQTRIIPNEELISEIGALINDGLEVKFKPKGMSMLPFIHEGKDSLLLKRCESFKVGDIVLAKVNNSRYVIHRIYSIREDWFILMGDGNIAGKEKCRQEDIIATAIKILKNGKEIDCQSPSHLRNARIWKALLPIRRYLLAIYKRIIL